MHVQIQVFGLKYKYKYNINPKFILNQCKQHNVTRTNFLSQKLSISIVGKEQSLQLAGSI